LRRDRWARPAGQPGRATSAAGRLSNPQWFRARRHGTLGSGAPEVTGREAGLAPHPANAPSNARHRAGCSIAPEDAKIRICFLLRNPLTGKKRSVKTKPSRICASVDVARTQQSREVLARALQLRSVSS
jgi:hypothetical protein